MTDSVENPYEALQNLIQRDPDYAWALHCNIAMPIMDSIGCTHEQANEAAAHLMQHLFDYDVTTHEHYVYGKSGAQQYAEMRMAADIEEDAAISRATGGAA